jgi:hypothetical protein
LLSWKPEKLPILLTVAKLATWGSVDIPPTGPAAPAVGADCCPANADPDAVRRWNREVLLPLLPPKLQLLPAAAGGWLSLDFRGLPRMPSIPVGKLL